MELINPNAMPVQQISHRDGVYNKERNFRNGQV